jgi:PAS domain S-box-containing protein
MAAETERHIAVRRVRVVFVDDEPQITRLVLRMNMDDPRHEFVVTTEPTEALAEVLSGRTDVLVTDLNMPGMDGFALIERARRHDPLLPIIALTARSAETEVQIQCLQRGANYFLAKPFDNETLLTAVDTFYEGAAAHREEQTLLGSVTRSRDFLNSVLDNTLDLVFARDLQGRYILANQAYEKLLGLKRNEILGRTAHEVLPEMTAEQTVARDREVLGTGGRVEGELRMPLRHGMHVFSDIRFPLRDEQGRIIAVCGIVRDITTSKRIQRAVEEKSVFLQTLIDTIPNPVFYKDTDGAYLGCNRAFCQLFGRRREEIVGKAVFDIAEMELATVYHEMDRELLASPDAPQAYENPVKDAEGRIRSMVYNKATFRRRDGQVGGIVGVMVDVTERKVAEEKLREAETRQRALIESIPAVTYTAEFGRERQLTFVSRQVETVLGYTRREIMGAPGLWTERIHPDDRGRVLEGLRQSAERNWPFSDEYRMRRADGRTIWVQDEAMPVRDEDNLLLFYQGVLHDVTARRQAEEALRTFRAALDSSADAVFLIDRETMRFVDANDTACGSLGYSRKSLLDASPHAVKPAFTDEELRAEFDRITANGDAGMLETVHRRKDGFEFPVEVRVRRWRTREADIYVSVARDITERRKAEEEMRQLNQRLELLSIFPENNPNIVLRVDLDGRITYANPAAGEWCQAQGVSSRELAHLFPPDFRERLDRAVATRETDEAQTTLAGRHYEVKLRAFPDLEACLVTVTDITELKRVSIEREMYYQAFQHAIHGVCITDTEGRLTHVNRAITELYGYPPEELIGENLRILNPGRAAYLDLGIGEREYEALFGGLWESITDPARGFWEGDLANRKRDGSIVWVHIFISAIRDDAGAVVGYVGMPMDVTERRQKEFEIRLECYRAITEIAETRDNETGMHLRRVSAFAGLIARHLGMPRKFVEDIEIFAPLHDIGKVGISDSILLAPRKLTDEEFEIMKTHATLGWKIIRNRPTLEMAADIAHSHHERWDGTGYPQGLAGEAIPLSARIVSVADVYDALRSERPYKKPWAHADILDLVKAGSGTQFDPKVVRAFLSLERLFDRISAEHPD